jgi:hypothetical protein
MTARQDLKPISETTRDGYPQVTGMDVSKWAETKGGPSRAASNPKYCYNMVILQPGEFVVACLWYTGLKQKGDRLYFELAAIIGVSNRTEPGTGSTNKRANAFDRHHMACLQRATPDPNDHRRRYATRSDSYESQHRVLKEDFSMTSLGQ